ncbi:hypothetical protein FHS78_000653 [Parvibaculum indicum]|uniref:hypothetical protein n=1 Tax=Parvibaculum indicum TaxID=562969 RepID=UPI00141EEE11|nr:hypothetical protein [Parvibaculum indicum]NIJ40383.1 hypothetical protein [Parvibaculum indicum]
MSRVIVATVLCTFFSTLSFAGDGWMANERVVHQIDDVSRAISEDGILRSREGRTETGAPYHYYTDGSGSFGRPRNGGKEQWRVDCKADAMDDTRKCTLYNYQTRIFIGLNIKGKFSYACVMGHDFPNRKAKIRIDKDKPFTTSADGCTSDRHVFEQLLKGREVTTRRYEWPYDYHRDQTAEIVGLKEAIDFTRFVQANIDTISFDK